MNSPSRRIAPYLVALSLIWSLACLGALAALAADAPAPDSFQKELAEWKAGRDTRLHSPTGWLTLIGLDWLKEGENSVGSAADARIRLPAGKVPTKAGTITLSGAKVTFQAAPGVAVTVDGKPPTGPVELRSDEQADEPTLVAFGSVNFYVINRGGRLAARVKDSGSETLTHFKGVESFPTDPSWRVVGHFEPYPPGRTLQVPTVLGTVDTMPEPGAVVFERNGATYRLDAVFDVGDTDYFIIFGDLTNRKETYGGGRFLYAKPADRDGKVTLDFNRAYNPPCVFTPYATCPLPPPQNKMPVRVEAEEKMYGQGHS